MVYYPYDTIENVAIAAFDDGAPVPVKQLEIAIAPVQTGTGDPAPDNVRPIYGFTKAEIAVNGVNQFDEEFELGVYSPLTGEPSESTNTIRGKNFYAVKGGEKYFSYIGKQGGRTVILFYDVNKTFLGTDKNLNIRNEIFTAPENACYFHFYMQNYGKEYLYDVSINYPATETDYHKFTGEITTVNFLEAAGTVYGGTLKYTGGNKYLLMMDYIGVDMGSLDWRLLETTKYFANVPTEFPNTGVGSPNNALCEVYKVHATRVVSGDLANKELTMSTVNSVGIVVRDDDYNADTPGLKASLSDKYLVYKIATPQTYEITAEAVETLYKNNVIFANTGNIIKLEYRLNQLDYYRRLEMYNFGYIMMDGGGIDLSSSDPQSITGAWARTVEAIKTGKPIFAYNTKYGTGKNLTPVPCFAWYINSTTAVIVGATLHIHVTSDDTCVVQDVAPSVNRALTMAIDELAEKAVDVDELKTTKVKAKK